MSLLISVFLHAILLSSLHGCSALEGLRIGLTHVDSHGNFSKVELIHRAAQRSHHRMTRLTNYMSNLAAADAATAPVPIHAGNGEFLMDLAIGTPSLPFTAILDTGSDLIWTQCKPCVECFPQTTPIFDPSRSSTFTKLSCSGNLCQALPSSSCSPDCSYIYTYGDSSSTQGVLASEKITFGPAGNPVSVPGIGFGCSDTNQGSGFSQASGIVGLGRGPLSLISQLGLGKFSYCLTSLDSSNKSPLFFGSLAELKGSGTQSTPLQRNTAQSSFYYLSLKGITVGAKTLKIPSTSFALNDDGTGGLIIDSGTSITYLEESAYKMVKKAFVSLVQLPVADGSDIGLDLCYKLTSDTKSVDVPKLILHFDGADLDLPAENYMVIDSSTGLLCLTVMGSTGMSILGNFQQQNFQIFYDLEKSMLSFAPAKCDQL